MPGGAGGALLAGVTLGLWYDPFFAVIAAAAVAWLVAPDPDLRPWRWWAAVGTVLGLWLLGDGVRLVLRARELGQAAPLVSGEPWLSWVAVVAWALAGILIGYVFPPAAGIAVTRLGRGAETRAVAVAVSVAISLALSLALSIAAR